MDLKVFSTLECGKVMFQMPSFYTCASLAPEQFDRFYSYSEFKSLSILCNCLENMNILAPKIGVLHGVSPSIKF
jgi:hypothetical protein